MKRVCGTAFLLGALFFFPFPNLLIAPGYASLPRLQVPTVREAVGELPSPWNHKVTRVMNETRWFYDELTLASRLLGHCFRNTLIQLGLRFVAAP
jgi:hypothetical protein